jgi:hypothetical protein
VNGCNHKNILCHPERSASRASRAWANPTWQDLPEGWGEKIELQIPRVARDDKSLGVVQNGAGEKADTKIA